MGWGDERGGEKEIRGKQGRKRNLSLSLSVPPSFSLASFPLSFPPFLPP